MTRKGVEGQGGAYLGPRSFEVNETIIGQHNLTVPIWIVSGVLFGKKPIAYFFMLA